MVKFLLSTSTYVPGSRLLITPGKNKSAKIGVVRGQQFAIDNGADLVVCHHPHIMQAVEVYNGKLIAHSLGDFVFDLDYPETYPTFVLNAKVNLSYVSAVKPCSFAFLSLTNLFVSKTSVSIE